MRLPFNILVLLIATAFCGNAQASYNDGDMGFYALFILGPLWFAVFLVTLAIWYFRKFNHQTFRICYRIIMAALAISPILYAIEGQDLVSAKTIAIIGTIGFGLCFLASGVRK